MRPILASRILNEITHKRLDMKHLSIAVLFLSISVLAFCVWNFLQMYEINHLKKQIRCLEANMIYIGDGFCSPH